MSKKLSYGVGYNSRTKYTARVNGKVSKAYYSWLNMIKRCYCPKTQEKQPTYIGCTIDEEWHDFQDFAEWFYNQEYHDTCYHLDKDILIPNNKVYNSKSCSFVPNEINVLFTDRRNARGKHAQGITWEKSESKYKAELSVNGKQKNLGRFKCPDEAYQVYKQAKEAYIKEKALEWQDRIADNVFQALMNWQLQS